MSDRPHLSLGWPVHAADWLARSRNLGVMLTVLTCCFIATYSVVKSQPVPGGVAGILGIVLTLNTASTAWKRFRTPQEPFQTPEAFPKVAGGPETP